MISSFSGGRVKRLSPGLIYSAHHRKESGMVIALVIIILLAIIWILLKLLGLAIKLPFKIIGFIFKQPFATRFWIVVIGYLLIYVFGGI